MKTTKHLLFVAALACGAQAAWAEQSSESVQTRTASAESYSGSGVGAIGARDHARVAHPANLMQDYLQEMGFTTAAPFPSRGGEIDD